MQIEGLAYARVTGAVVERAYRGLSIIRQDSSYCFIRLIAQPVLFRFECVELSYLTMRLHMNHGLEVPFAIDRFEADGGEKTGRACR